MKRIGAVVTLVTLFVIFYNIVPFIDISDKIILCMFFISPFLVVFMVLAILKYGRPSGNTCDERYYEDIDTAD